MTSSLRRRRPIHLLLVRHGESTHNISSVAEYGDHGRDPSLYDAPLSPIGTTQACALSTQHPDLVTADLILSSPLTRALQTMCGAFPPTSTSPTMEVWPLAAEHLTASCDIGSSPADLSTRFPHLDFSALPPVWWYVDADTSREDPAHSRERFREFGFYEPFSSFEARVDAFVAALRVRAARWDAALVSKGSDEHSPSAAFSVVCFGHSDFFNLLCERHLGLPGCWLNNAEVLRVELPPTLTTDAGAETVEHAAAATSSGQNAAVVSGGAQETV